MTSDLPDPTRIVGVSGFQDALIALLGPGSLDQVSRRLGGRVSRNAIAKYRRREQLPRQDTLRLIVTHLDPGREDDWHAAWLRVGGAKGVPATPENGSANSLPLPPDIFWGRAGEMLLLEETVLSGRWANALLHGVGGVGKTAVAVQLAYQVRDRFPGGCHYVDLLGYSGAGQRPSTYQVAGRLLRDAQGDQVLLADDQEVRFRQYRTWLDESAALVVLDNVGSLEDVAPLLASGAGAGRVLLTSRNDLGLPGTTPFGLDRLESQAAERVLRELLPVGRLAGVDGALGRIVGLSDGLPLVLRLLAAHLVTNPALAVAELVERLVDEHRRLAGENAAERAVRAAFKLVHGDLTEDEQQAFAVLAVMPGTDTDTERAAAAMAQDPSVVEPVLERFLELGLLIQRTEGRYRMHDLISAFGQELPGSAPRLRKEVLARLLVWTVSRADAHSESMFTFSAGNPSPAREAARMWFAAERANLVATVLIASSTEQHRAVLRLGEALRRPLFGSARYPDSVQVADLCIRAAQAVGNTRAVAEALVARGQALMKLGRLGPGRAAFEEALHHYEESGDDGGRARLLKELGNIAWHENNYHQARRLYQLAYEVQERIGDRAGAAVSLRNVGAVYQQLGEHEEALRRYREALEVHRGIHDAVGMAQTLNNLALTHERMGELGLAQAEVEEAQELAHELDDPGILSSVFTNLGNISSRLGRHREASELLKEAVDQARSAGSPHLEVEALNCLGDVYRAQGDPQRALLCHLEALERNEMQDRYEAGHAYEGIATVHADLGDRRAARENAARAVARYETLDVTVDLERARKLLESLKG
ncbi:tetratricopeptide repeat protein [Kineosporia sp. J2-2]|uniref:Tetratricopeptide repeat protein n=1 Tax=Kineosporia corallincola TaxID=2835133 RepID=A0ABS5TI29_9ACTN|nr:tetratricopeptide repeat protein [Kineosporia corallincola]MBT0770752.1 tetratricopeptide repeat protein [Kineosporia corallincola]